MAELAKIEQMSKILDGQKPAWIEGTKMPEMEAGEDLDTMDLSGQLRWWADNVATKYSWLFMTAAERLDDAHQEWLEDRTMAPTLLPPEPDELDWEDLLEEWQEKYKPMLRATDTFLFETYGDDEKFAKRLLANHVWTVCDCDGDLYIHAGVHHVNRINYMVTLIPWEHGKEISEVLWSQATEKEDDN